MISKKEVEHIAGLARIGLDEKELDKLSQDLSAVLDWIDELKKVDVTGVEPTAHIAGMENRTREDKENNFENKTGIIKLFPESKDGFDKIKSVM